MSVTGDPVESEISQVTDNNVETLMEKVNINEDSVNTVKTKKRRMKRRKIQTENNPFVELTNVSDVAYMVIKLLGYYDLVNLACVNKKWYRTVVNAPQSVKPVIKIRSICLSDGRARGNLPLVGRRGRPARIINNNWNLATDHVFNMIKQVDADSCYVLSYKDTTVNGFKDFTKFLELLVNHENRSGFNCKEILFKHPSFCKIDRYLLSRVFTSCNNITISSISLPVPISWRVELQQVILESLSLRSVSCVIPVDTEFVHDMLMQIDNGQRHHLMSFSVVLVKDEDFWSHAIRDIEPSRVRKVGNHTDSIYVFEVPAINNHFTIEFFCDSTNRSKRVR